MALQILVFRIILVFKMYFSTVSIELVVLLYSERPRICPRHLLTFHVFCNLFDLVQNVAKCCPSLSFGAQVQRSV